MGATRFRLHDLCAGNPEIDAWLREHDLDPYQVALMDHVGPFIDGDQMTVGLYLERDGGRYYDPATDDAAVEIRTVSLHRPPPDLVNVDGEAFPATVAVYTPQP